MNTGTAVIWLMSIITIRHVLELSAQALQAISAVDLSLLYPLVGYLLMSNSCFAFIRLQLQLSMNYAVRQQNE